MAAIAHEDIIEYKKEADHIREEQTNLTSYDNSKINVKSEVVDKTFDYNTKDEAKLQETVESVTDIGIKKEFFESVSNIEIPGDDGDVLEYKNEANHIWVEETNFINNYDSEIKVKSEVDDKPIDYNTIDEANLKETVENVIYIRIKKETSENISDIEISEERVQNDNGIEVTGKTIKNFNKIEFMYNVPGDFADEVHSDIPETQGSPHCERCALSFASQEAFDDHKIWSAERADERTVKIIPKCMEPVVFKGVQFGAPMEKPKADSSNENTFKTVNSDANIPEFFKGTELETKSVPYYTGTVVVDRKKSLSESPNNKFICHECGHQSPEKDSIILHIKTKHVKNVHNRKKQCAYSTVTKDGLEKHFVNLHAENKQYFCDVCTNRFTSKITLGRHKQCCDIKNNVSNTFSAVKPYSCTECSKKFSYKYHLNRHMKIHTGEKSYSCTVCNIHFGLSDHLKSHMRIHAGEKPYSCTVCKKQFSLSNSFYRHIKIHTGEKPYSCTECSKKFAYKYHLNRHMKTHTGEKPYSCTVCNIHFGLSDHLKSHMRIHTGEKPYSCTACKKQFSHNYSFYRHMRIHTGEKPYSCTVCKKQFSDSSNINIHMRIHTGEKPYSCTVCSKHFSMKSNLNSHMRIHRR